MDDLLQEFIAETRETLEALSGEIVAWEAAPNDRGRLDAIFRFVHTVKGSCGFLDLPRLERLAHAAEDVLAAVRAGTRTPDRALVSAVLAIVDRIGEIVEAIDAGRGLDDSGEDLLVAALAEGAEAQGLAQQATVARAPTRSVRLSVDLLDRMMSGMSDMVLARNELARRLREDGADPSVEAALERLSATVAEMRDTVTRTRMQRIDALFSALPRMVRDTAAALDKSVALVVEGADVELDREMIEMMRDPLVHIVRNAIDHGIESPAERRAVGKRENGRLLVAARQSGNRIIIDIVDDGRGIDVNRVIAKLVANGDKRALNGLPEQAKLALVFESGLSTKDEVTAISGRGVGMDVVRANIEQIGGRIELDNSPGRGLSISIHVPLTLSILSTIVVSVGGQSFAVARDAIEEIVRVNGEGIRVDRLGDTPVATVRDRQLPYVDLAGILGIADPQAEAPMMAVIGVPGGAFALAVDDVLDSEELVIKPAAPAVMATGVYAGQTLPDSGRPMLLIDCLGVAAAAGLVFERDIAADTQPTAEPVEEQVSALLFRDLDGQRRAVPLGVVDRVETVAADTIRRTGGRDRMAVDGAIVPVASIAPIDIGRPAVVLRLTDGQNEMGYAIAEALDIVGVPPAIAPAATAGPIQGVVLLAGEQIELLDTYWLFANYAAGIVRAEAQPVCLLAGDGGGWMANVLRPLVEAAGYRVVAEPPAGDPVSVVLALDAAEPAEAGTAPVLRLSSDPTPRPGHIYRYDRAALLAALERSSDREQAA